MKNYRCIVIAAIIASLSWGVIAASNEITLQFEFSWDDLEITRQKVDPGKSKEREFDMIKLKNIPGCLNGEPGEPWLPAKHTHCLLPPGCVVSSMDVQILDEQELPGTYQIMPAQPCYPLSDPGPHPFVSEKALVYAKTNPIPEKAVVKTSTGIMRGYYLAGLRIHPVSYVPASGKITFRKKIKVTIKTKADTLKQSKSNRKDTSFANTVGSLVANPDLLSTYESSSGGGLKDGVYPPSTPSKDDVKYLLIVYDSSWLTYFDDLLEWKTKKGIPAKAVTIQGTEGIAANYSGADLQEKIKACIRDYYFNHGIVWVCLGGDSKRHSCSTKVPHRDCNMLYGSTWKNLGADHYYACLDNQPNTTEDNWKWDTDSDGKYGERGENIDLYPDVFISRIPAMSAAKAAYVVTKSLDYEKDPPTSNHSEKMLLCGMKVSCYKNGISDAHYQSNKMYNQYIDPIWGGTRKRLYDTGTDFSGGSSYDVTPAHINEQLNYDDTLEVYNGYNFFHTHGHGGPFYWGTEWYSGAWNDQYVTKHERDYEGTEVRNKDHYVNIISTQCYSNTYSDFYSFDEFDESMGETFILDHLSGASSYIGSSNYGWGSSFYTIGPSMKYSISFYQSVFDGKVPDKFNNTYTNEYRQHVGADLAYAKMARACECTSNYCMRWLIFSINLLGDPEMCLYTEDPSSFSVSYSAVDGDVTVKDSSTNNPIEGALVCISSAYPAIEDYFTAYTDSSGVAQFPAAYFTQSGAHDLVVTKRNYIPYEGQITLTDNDECFGAKTIDLSTGSGSAGTYDDLDSATLSTQSIPSCASGDNPQKDVWYRIHPGKDKKVFIELKANFFNTNNFILYRGGCGSLEFIDCGNHVDGFAYPILNVYTDPNNDYDYLVRVYRGGSSPIDCTVYCTVTDVTDPILHYPMDEGENTTLVNYGSDGSNGTLPDSQSWIGGARGCAVDFDGTNDRIQNSSTSGFDIEEGSVLLWVKDVTETSPYSAAFAVKNGATPLHRLRIRTNDAFVDGNTYGEELTASFTFNDGDWHQVVVTWSDTESKRQLYIDGNLKDEGNYSVSSYTLPSYYWIGYYEDGDDYFWNGSMDELRVYDYVLEEGQMAYLTPINDECSFAETLTNGVPSDIDPDLNLATPSDVDSACACGMPYKDIWYKFQPSSDSYVTIELDCNIYNSGFAFYSGSCGSLTLEGCSEGTQGSEIYEFLTDDQVQSYYYLRVFNDSDYLIQGDIKVTCQQLTDPIQYFTMDETNNAVNNDGRSGSSSDGFYMQGIKRVVGPNGGTDYALSFNGINGRVEGVNTIYFDRSKGAVVMNVKQVVDNSENYNQSVAFAVAYDWSTEIIRLRVEENQVAYYNDTCGYVTTSADLDDGDWHQVAITWNWNENRRRIYIDGEMKKEGTYTEHYYTIPTDYRIGDFHSTYYFRGYMDELRVYDRELYPFELEELVPPRRAVSPPDNDECEDAEVLTSGQTKTGALTASATPSNENECNPEVPDVWYKFTVPLEYDEPCVIVNYSDWGDASFEGFASIYSGTCEELTQEVCDTTRNSSHPYEFHLEYLSQNPGETIYICVGSERETINQQLQLTCFDKMEEK